MSAENGTTHITFADHIAIGVGCPLLAGIFHYRRKGPQ